MPLTPAHLIGGLPRYDPKTLKGIPRSPPMLATAGSICYYYDDVADDDDNGDENETKKSSLNKTIVYTGSRLSLPCPATSLSNDPPPTTQCVSPANHRASPRDERRAPGDAVVRRNSKARVDESGSPKKTVSEIIMAFDSNDVNYDPNYYSGSKNVSKYARDDPNYYSSARDEQNSGENEFVSARNGSNYGGNGLNSIRNEQNYDRNEPGNEPTTEIIRSNGSSEIAKDVRRDENGRASNGKKKNEFKPIVPLKSRAEKWSVGVGRFLFYLKQLPALFLLLICGWTLLGYTFFVVRPFAENSAASNATVVSSCEPPPAKLSVNEFVVAGAAILTALAAVLGALCGGGSRVSAYKKVTVHCSVRVIFAALCIVFSVVAIVHAVLVVLKLYDNETVKRDGISGFAPLECFTPVGRLVINCGALAAAALILLLSLFSFAFSVVALNELANERKFMRKIVGRGQ